MAVEQASRIEGVALVQPARPRSGAPSSQDGGSSFQSVLGDSMDDTPAADASIDSEAQPGNKPAEKTKRGSHSDAAAADGTAAAAADPAQAAVPPAAQDAAASQAAGSQAAGSQAAGSQAAAQAAADAADAGSDAAVTVPAMTTVAPESVDAAASRSARPVLRGAAGAAGAAAAQAQDAAADAPLSTTAFQAQRAGAQGAAQSAAQAAAQQASQTARQTAQQAATQAAMQAASQDRSTAQASQADAVAQLLGQETQALAQTLASTTEFSAARRTDRLADGAGLAAPGAASAGTADGAFSRHALTDNAAVPVAQSGIDAGSASTSMEDRMAAQVSYWLSQKTQNAELSLDLLDGKRVEVNISMTGNEAQVAFRSAHGVTRDMLGSALPQLRELLGNEGVVLTGVTVDAFGTQGQRGTFGDESQSQGDRRGGRSGRALVSAADVAAPVRSSGAMGGSTGRSLDLYV